MEPPAAVQPIAPSTQTERPAPSTAAVSSQPETEPQVALIAPLKQSTPTRVDYGWLSDTILKRVEELKRYPVEARGDRAEGKVIVKAVIKEDGTVGHVEVVRSSGFQSLDQAALELMRHAGPFNLSHALGKPQVIVQIPLNYRLDRP
jgi:protein TonB